MKTMILAVLLWVPLAAASDFEPKSREALEHMTIDELADEAAMACTVYTKLMPALAKVPAAQAARSTLYLTSLTEATAALTEANLIVGLAHEKEARPWFVAELQNALLTYTAAQCEALWQAAFERRFPNFRYYLKKPLPPQVLEIPGAH